ncbi:MAG: TolC family protein [Planctomycetota bacterium]
MSHANQSPPSAFSLSSHRPGKDVDPVSSEASDNQWLERRLEDQLAERDVPKNQLRAGVKSEPWDVTKTESLAFPEENWNHADEFVAKNEPLPSIVQRSSPAAGDLDPTSFRPITEQDLLDVALTDPVVMRSLGATLLQNPEAVASQYDRAIRATDPFFGPKAALAQFDTQLAANLNTANNDRVFNNQILGGATEELVQDLVTSQASATRTTTTGTQFSLNADHLYDNNNRSQNTFRNYYETQWTASIRQPLLQGAGRNFNLIAGPSSQPGLNFSRGLWLANLDVKISQADFQIQLREYVTNLYETYWSLRRRYDQYESLQEAEALARDTWTSIRARNRAGLRGGNAAEEAQARSRYHGYRRQIQAVLSGQGVGDTGGLYAIERQLRRLVGMPITDGQLLRPEDSPPMAKFVFDYDSLMARAVIHRAEIRRQDHRLRDQELRLLAAKNFMLPRLDAIGRYRGRGFGDDLTGGGSRFASAYKDLFSLDHQEFEFGMEFAVAAGRRQAKAAVRNAMLQLRREREVTDQVRKEVELQIANAHSEVESAYLAMQISMEQVDASRDRLEASMAQFEADKIRIEFLLDAQEELLQARNQFASDSSRYAVSLINVAAKTGTLLNDLGVLSDCGG